nr:2303_t:CDS:2 [Entrophospora candida]
MGRPNKRQIQITKPAQDKKEEAVIQHVDNTSDVGRNEDPNKRQIQIIKPAQDKKEEAVIQHIFNPVFNNNKSFEIIIEKSNELDDLVKTYKLFMGGEISEEEYKIKKEKFAKASGRNVNEINDQPADDDGINLEDDWKKAINSVEQALETPI